MAWIKRNKFFVLSMAAGLILTGYCGWLFYNNLSDVSAKADEYQSNLASLNALQSAQIPATKENIDRANEEQRQAAGLLADLQKSIPPFPPPDAMDEQKFKAFLGQSISDLGGAADSAGVSLPDGFAFTFTAQQRQLNYPAENIRPWLQQLTQIKALCAILFDARVNSIVSLQRVRVSPTEDGPASDFFDAAPVTNAPLVSTPYKMCFRGFSRELASVLDKLAQSSNCLVVKTIQVQHEADDSTASASPMLNTAFPVPANPAPPGRPGRFGEAMGAGSRTPGNAPGGAPVTVLSERLLRVSISVDMVTPSGGGH
jgi:hypothetical protein